MSISEQDYLLAVKTVREHNNASLSNLQRKLNWGYGLAAWAFERMEKEMIVSSMAEGKQRQVYPVKMHELWKELQTAKANAVPEWGVIASRLSINYLFNTIPEMEFKDQFQKETILYHLNYAAAGCQEAAKQFVEDDHRTQREWGVEQEMEGL